jgi:predicted RNA-binding Zn-ribbon protein involved in translation (DUF1610 family)
MIKPEVIEEYIKNPYFCPECEEDEITKEHEDYRDRGLSHSYSCDKCGFKWREVYILVNIESNET